MFKTFSINVEEANEQRLNIPKALMLVFSPAFPGTLTILMNIYINRNKLDDVILNATFIGACVVLIISSFALYYKKDVLKQLIQQLIETSCADLGSEDSQQYTLWALQEKNYIKFCFLIFVTLTFLFSLAALNPLCEFMVTGELSTYMYPAWYPWSDESVIGLTLILIFQLWTLVVTFWIYFSQLLILIFLLIEFLRQYERLRNALVTAEGRAINQMFELFSHIPLPLRGNAAYINYRTFRFQMCYKDAYNKFYKEEITKCIKHHQQLTK